MTTGRVVAILLVFLVFGPALGAVAIGILGTLSLPFLPAQLPRGFSAALAVALMLPVSYMAGGMQALIAGGVTTLALKRGRSPWLPVLVVAALSAIGFVFYAGMFDESAPAFIVAHVVSAAACLGICAPFGLLLPSPPASA
ncbi:MAG: hypothetical protein KF849_11110 [Rhizobiaceae bacterium]|nr:hypothetical protein [Rhizobiaceae bacterium]